MVAERDEWGVIWHGLQRFILELFGISNPCYEFKDFFIRLSCYFGDYIGLVLLVFLSAI